MQDLTEFALITTVHRDVEVVFGDEGYDELDVIVVDRVFHALRESSWDTNTPKCNQWPKTHDLYVVLRVVAEGVARPCGRCYR
jgi:hypothetical protein